MNFKEFLEGQQAFDDLIAESVDDRDYAVDMLQKITKVAEYLIKSRLNNPNDLVRFEKFLDMIAAEAPKMEKSIKTIQNDIRGVTTNRVSQSPRQHNYN